MPRRSARRRLPPSIQMPGQLWRRPVGTIVVMLLAVIVIWQRSPWRPPLGDDRARYHNRTCTVVKVVDGDTIDVDIPDRRYPTTRIRLWGVDTPEVASTGQPDMHFGAEASRFTAERVLNQPVRLELGPGRTRDKYDRLLAYVYIVESGEMLNELLVSTGHAYADWRFDHSYRRRLRDVETRAERERVGLWADAEFEDYPAWRQRMESRADED